MKRRTTPTFKIGDLVEDLVYEKDTNIKYRGCGIVLGHDYDKDPIVFFFKLQQKQGCYKHEIKLLSRM